MPAKSWSHGTDHAAQYPRGFRKNQFERYWWHLESGNVKIANTRPGDGWVETTKFNYQKRAQHSLHSDAASAAVTPADTAPEQSPVKPAGSQAAPVS